MSYPNITFRISAHKDFETLQGFIKDAAYDNGRNLRWAVFKKHPSLKACFDKENVYRITDEAAVRTFINTTYHTKRASMSRTLLQHKQRWEIIAPRYFRLVDILFGNRAWPQGKYIAFGTIWGMYPRFLEDKTFQIPFRHRTPTYVPVVIAHELLHFMFYDYLYQRYPKYSHPKHIFFVWHVSEIFNTVVQNSPAWIKHFKRKSLMYPEHREIAQRISNTWNRHTNGQLDAMVDAILKEAKTLPTAQ